MQDPLPLQADADLTGLHLQTPLPESNRHHCVTDHTQLMPAYGSIEHGEPRHSKSRVAIAVLSGMLLLVAVAGAIRFVKFHESQAAVVGTKLFHSEYESDERAALEQLSSSLDRQLETLNQLEAKVLPSHLTTGSVPDHAAAAADSRDAAPHVPEGKSESFLADIMGIESPAISQHAELTKSFQSKKSVALNSSSFILLSPVLIVALLSIFL